MVEQSPDKKSAVAAMTKADPMAAAVSFVAFVLSLLHIPSLLHLTTAATTAIGSAVIFSAALVRGYLHYRKGEEVALQDLAAAAIGAIFLALSLAGAPNVVAIDADTAAMLGSGLVTLLTVRRARNPTY